MIIGTRIYISFIDLFKYLWDILPLMGRGINTSKMDHNHSKSSVTKNTNLAFVIGIVLNLAYVLCKSLLN